MTKLWKQKLGVDSGEGGGGGRREISVGLKGKREGPLFCTLLPFGINWERLLGISLLFVIFSCESTITSKFKKSNLKNQYELKKSIGKCQNLLKYPLALKNTTQ